MKSRVRMRYMIAKQLDYDGNLPEGNVDVFPFIHPSQKTKLVEWAFAAAERGELAVRETPTTFQLRSASTFTMHNAMCTDIVVRGKTSTSLREWYLMMKRNISLLASGDVTSLASV